MNRQQNNTDKKLVLLRTTTSRLVYFFLLWVGSRKEKRGEKGLQSGGFPENGCVYARYYENKKGEESETQGLERKKTPSSTSFTIRFHHT